jgi:hypothetical protein
VRQMRHWNLRPCAGCACSRVKLLVIHSGGTGGVLEGHSRGSSSVVSYRRIRAPTYMPVVSKSAVCGRRHTQDPGLNIMVRVHPRHRIMPNSPNAVPEAVLSCRMWINWRGRRHAAAPAECHGCHPGEDSNAAASKRAHRDVSGLPAEPDWHFLRHGASLMASRVHIRSSRPCCSRRLNGEVCPSAQHWG